MDDSYDESAFIKLVVKLLRHEVPARLGDPWKALAVPSPWRGHDHTPTPHTADELRRGEREAADLLRLFQKGHASPEIAIEVVALAGEMG